MREARATRLLQCCYHFWPLNLHFFSKSSWSLQATMSTREYFCDCAPRCKKRKRVSRTTFYSHAKFRAKFQAIQEAIPLMDYNAFAEMHGVPTLVPTLSSSSCRHPIEANCDPNDTSHASAGGSVEEDSESDDPSGGCPSGRYWSMEKSVSPASNGPQEDENDGGAGRSDSESSDNGDQVRSLIKL